MNILWQNLRLNNWGHSIVIHKLIYLIMSCCDRICINCIINVCYILRSCLCSILKRGNLWADLICILIANILSTIVNLLKLLRSLSLSKIWIVGLIELTKLFPHDISCFRRIQISLLLRFTCISNTLLIFSSTILNCKIRLIVAIVNIIIRCITIQWLISVYWIILLKSSLYWWYIWCWVALRNFIYLFWGFYLLTI